MTYGTVKHLKPSEFKRLCGVQPGTFEAMLSVVRQVESYKPPGRPSKLSLEDQLLMTLENGARISDIFPHWAIMGGK